MYLFLIGGNSEKKKADVRICEGCCSSMANATERQERTACVRVLSSLFKSLHEKHIASRTPCTQRLTLCTRLPPGEGSSFHEQTRSFRALCTQSSSNLYTVAHSQKTFEKHQVFHARALPTDFIPKIVIRHCVYTGKLELSEQCDTNSAMHTAL